MARPRRSAHPDANQAEIVADLRRLAFLVIDVSPWLLTPDIFVWGWGTNSPPYWTAWEIKTDKGKLTDRQQAFIDRWPPGTIQVARTTEDILRAYGRAV